MKKISLEMVTSWKVLVPAIIIAGAAMMAATFVARSNADYTCTRVVENEYACAVDSWSSWTDIDADPEINGVAGSTYTVRQSRTGSGTKDVYGLVENFRSVARCSAEAQGFSRQQICQIEETRTVQRTLAANPNDPEGGVVPVDVVDDGIAGSSVETSGGVVAGSEQLFDGIAGNTEVRRTLIRADIFAVPALLRYGDTTDVTWSSRETTSCSVSGDNGDQWDPVAEQRDADNIVIVEADDRTSGEETSGQINGRTVYTLTCEAFDGSTVTDTAVVSRVPVVNEQ